MKSHPIRLASLFYETGMIDSATFSLCTEAYESESKPLLDVLRQDVSLKSIRELMSWTGSTLTMEINLPFAGKSEKADKGGKKQGPSLHDALSQPLYLTKEETKALLNAWKPPVKELVATLHEASVLDVAPEDLLKSAGKGEGVYNRLMDTGHVHSKDILRAASVGKTTRANRLLLALNLLKHNDVLLEEDCDTILQRYREEGPKSIPLLNQEVLAFIRSEPEMPEVNARQVHPPADLLSALPETFIRQNPFLPYRRLQAPLDRLEILLPDPFYVELTDTLAFLTGIPVVGYYAAESDIISRINELFEGRTTASVPSEAPAARAAVSKAEKAAPEQTPRSRAKSAAPDQAPTDKIADSHSAVEIVSLIIEGGVQHSATDVHLEPHGQDLRVRYRIDGRLRTIMHVPASQVLSVTSRIKVLANLDVTERRRPQDGHFSLKIGEGAFDFRISTLPTHIGEKTVIRILDESRVMLSLNDLGMPANQSAVVNKWISRPHGLLLVTGPTGSGKTSTLYAALNTVNNEISNIVTIEDPVEYRLDGINQVQVDPTFDISFAQGLRSILRQDPDIIMVGEIRDPETARIAMRAALTGHLVFSTLHTNTAAGAMATLMNMGIEPYMLTSAITGVINQRLIRVLCKECKKPFIPIKGLLEQLKMDTKSRKRMWKAKGCAACLTTGYKGRTGVYEIMPMNQALSDAILAGKNEHELVDIMQQSGFGTLLESAAAKLYDGITSPEEILETLVVEE
jgi:type II secretory ATPase GspE/PulE/Tfp pilus assembly ATPase PilB-like protein